MEEVRAELQLLREQAQLTANIVTPAVCSHSFPPKHTDMLTDSCQDGFLSAADLRVLYTNLEEEQEDDGSESRKRRLEMPAKRLRDARAVSPSKDASLPVLPPAHERCINFRNPACEATIRSPVGHRMLGEFRMRGKAQMLSGHLKMLLIQDLSGHKKTEQLLKYRYLLPLRKSEQYSAIQTECCDESWYLLSEEHRWFIVLFCRWCLVYLFASNCTPLPALFMSLS